VLHRTTAPKSVNLSNDSNSTGERGEFDPRRNGGVQNKAQNPSRVEPGRRYRPVKARRTATVQPGNDPPAEEAERRMELRQVSFVALSEKGESLLEGEDLGVEEVGGGGNGVVLGEGEGDIDAEVVGRENECRKAFVREEVESDPHHVSFLLLHLLLLLLLLP